MRSALVFATATLLYLLQPGLAHAAAAPTAFELRCQRDMKPVLEVHAHEAPVVVNNKLSTHVLLTRDSYGRAGQMMLGLTANTTRTEVVFDGPALLDQDAGRECVSPRIRVDLSYEPLHVYVAREFSEASCSYRAIYAHEMQHVELYRTQLPLVGQAVREALERRYGGAPLYAPAGHGLDRLADDVDNWLRPLIRAELASLRVLQRDIDSPEEEFRLSRACQGEAASRLGAMY